MANTVTEKTQLSNGVWVVPDGDNNWGGELNDNFVLLNGLLDRKTLTFTKNAQTVATFNGTQNVTVDIGTQFATNDDIDGIFGDSQVEPDLTKDVNVGNLDRFKTDLSSRVVSSVSLDNNDDLEVTYLDGQSQTVSLPWPEIPEVPTSVVDASFSSNTNNLELTLSDDTTKNVSIPIPTVPTSVVDGAIVDTNKLELTFSDQTTKQLTLPSGGSSPVTRTVTRVPVYFEIHFKVGAVAESSVFDYNECTADSVLGITAQDVKDMVKVSFENEFYNTKESSPESSPIGIIVTDVTATKAYDEFDKVFLVAVNLCCPYCREYRGTRGTIKFSLGKTFGNITISDSTILTSINGESENPVQSVSAQVTSAYPEITIGNDCRISEQTNYFEITAYMNNADIQGYLPSIYNDWFGYYEGYGCNCSFELQLIQMSYDDTPATFTVNA